jgi:hypothetical protein
MNFGDAPLPCTEDKLLQKLMSQSNLMKNLSMGEKLRSYINFPEMISGRPPIKEEAPQTRRDHLRLTHHGDYTKLCNLRAKPLCVF